ncbi:hypothetical protein [Cellulomonas soli]
MRTSRRLAAVTTTATAALLVVATALAAPASADEPTPPSGTTTISVDTAHLQQLCDRVPQAVDRLESLVTRIQADAGTAGSTAWLHAQAGTARGAGRDAAARRMDTRAQLRADRVTTLQSAADRLRVLDSSICSQLDAS